MRLYNLLISILIFSFAYSFTGCEQNSGITESGLEYEFIKKGKGRKLENGQYVVINMEIVYENDSVLISTSDEGFPAMIQYFDTLWEKNAGQFYEGIYKMKVGDSALFKVNCYNLFKLSWKTEVPRSLDPDATITLYVGVKDIISPQQFGYQRAINQIKKKKKRERIVTEQLYFDIALIDQYFEEIGVIPNETESGIRYIINNEGSGPTPVLGSVVIIKYDGYFLDEIKFDSSSNYDGPFKFRMGQKGVIIGWQEMLRMMPKGANFTMYLPSGLAYGPTGKGDLIAPNTVLVFDLELVDFKQH